MNKPILLLFLSMSLLFSNSAFADHTVTYKSNLIPFNAKTLEEPPTEIEFKINLKTKSKVDNPFTEQLLRDAVTPYLKDIKDEVEGIMKATDELLQSGEVDEETAEMLVKQLNRNFKNILKDSKKKAENLLKKQWEELVKEDKELRDWKISAAVEISKGGFTVIQSAVNAVGSGGLSLAIDIFSIVKNVITVADNLKKLLIGEEKARKDLLDSISDVEKKIKGEKRSVITNLKDFFGGSENALEEDLETYNAKLTGVRKQAQKLSKLLNKLLNEQDELQAVAKEEGGDLAAGLKDIEKMTAQYLEAIDGLNDSHKIGKQLKKQGEQLLKLARDKEGKASKIRDKIYKMIELGDKLYSAIDPVDRAIEYGSDAAGGVATLYGKYIDRNK